MEISRKKPIDFLSRSRNELIKLITSDEITAKASKNRKIAEIITKIGDTKATKEELMN